MDAYLNELSVRVFSNNEEAQDAFLLLGKCFLGRHGIGS